MKRRTATNTLPNSLALLGSPTGSRARQVDRSIRLVGWLVVAAVLMVGGASASSAQDVQLDADDVLEIVRGAWENFRGRTSYGELTMTIHRPDWERSVSMRAWTEGSDQSLVRVTAPRKDVGTGTLILDDRMWTFAPKINRVIKVPSSMMGQSWMGSDFSNKDVSRADDIVDQYDHRLLEQETHEGLVVYVVESIPKEDSAVVWGKEILKIREDGVLLVEEFYDQDGELVKTLQALEIGRIGGRMMATRQRMAKTDTEDEWTEIRFDELTFDVDLDPSVFTLSNLRNPRD